MPDSSPAALDRPAEPSLDALLAVPRLGPCAVSPDGRLVAWTWSELGATADVYAAATTGDSPPLRLSATAEATVVCAWTPDSRALLVAQDHGGDEHLQLFRIDLDAPGELQPLTAPQPPYFLRGGRLHPDGRRLIYAANVDFTSGEVLEASWIYRHDLLTGERHALAHPVRASDTVPELSDDGAHVLYMRSDRHPAGVQAWLVGIDGRNDREILNFGESAKVTASWCPDSRRILFLADAGGYRRLGIFEIERSLVRWLIDGPRRNLESVFVPRAAGEDLAVVVEVRNARARAFLLDLSKGEERGDFGTGGFIPRGVAPDGTWIGTYSAATHPTDVIRRRSSGATPTCTDSVTRLWDRTALRSQDLTAAEDFRWQSVDGLAIQGWLYRPSVPPIGTIVHVHGGPTAHAEDAFDARIQYLVQRGFTVLAPNYRGSTGFSLAFQEAVKVDGWGGREQDDIRTGIEALIERGLAEPGKIGITGTSYGGYSSWWAITHCPPELVAAAAPICGMTDLVVDYYTTRPDLRPYSEEMMGGSPEQVPERYRSRSPIHYVREIRGRLLIVQGLRDPNVTPENMEVVLAALDDAGISYELLTFADEGHGIKQGLNLRLLLSRLTEFFAGAFASTADERSVAPGSLPGT